MTPQLLLSLFLFSGSVLSLLMGIGQSVIREPSLRNRLFSIFFICLAGLQLQGFLFNMDMAQMGPDLPLVLLSGPFLFFLYREVTGDDYTLKPGQLAHLLPALTATIVYISKPALVTSPQGDWIFIGALAHTFLYLVFVVRATTFVWTLDIKPGERPAQLIFVSAVAVALSVLVALLLFLDLQLLRTAIYPAMQTVIMFYSIVVGHRYPELYQLTIRSRPLKEYKKTSLTRIGTQDIQTRLDKALDDDKLYEDDEITLRSLAHHMRVTPHQLSEYINLHLGTNFSSVINGRRIDAARKLLTDNPDMEVLSIAYQVGFGSKTSFNRVFRQYTAQSPTEFRKRRRTLS